MVSFIPLNLQQQLHSKRIYGIIQAEAFDYLDAPVEIVAGRNTPIPFSRNLEQACIPQVDDIVAAVRRAVYA